MNEIGAFYDKNAQYALRSLQKLSGASYKLSRDPCILGAAEPILYVGQKRPKGV